LHKLCLETGGNGMDAASGPVMQANFARERLDGLASGLAVLFDELAHGVLVTSIKGNVVHANQAARLELARAEIIGLHEGRLHAVDNQQERELTQALAKAETGRRSLVSLRCGTRGRMSIAVVPLRSDRPAAAPHAALVLSRSSVCDPLMLCFYARTHGLTPAEEQVLAVLCQGYSTPQAAVQLEVAVSTIRSHVRSLCAKTQAHGVRELVGQVAVLPPLGAARLLDPLH
jgi:DNA-binding CsgD family transcriptional regulator